MKTTSAHSSDDIIESLILAEDLERIFKIDPDQLLEEYNSELAEEDPTPQADPLINEMLPFNYNYGVGASLNKVEGSEMILSL